MRIIWDDRGVPNNLVENLDSISVIVTLRAEQGFMVLKLVKKHEEIVSEDLSLKLDPKDITYCRNVIHHCK